MDEEKLGYYLPRCPLNRKIIITCKLPYKFVVDVINRNRNARILIIIETEEHSGEQKYPSHCFRWYNLLSWHDGYHNGPLDLIYRLLKFKVAYIKNIMSARYNGCLARHGDDLSMKLEVQSLSSWIIIDFNL